MSVNRIGCYVESGWTYGCDLLQQHGIKSLFVLPHTYFPDDEIDSTGVYYNSNELITGTDLPASYWQQIQVLPEVSTYDWREVEDSKTGLIYYEHIVNFELANYEALSRKYFLQLTQKPYVVVVGANDGRYILLGKDYGLKAIGNGTSGKIYTDFGGIKITMTGLQKYPPYQINGGAVTYLNASVGGSGGGGVPTDEPIHN